jgi:hypothetical protein
MADARHRFVPTPAPAGAARTTAPARAARRRSPSGWLLAAAFAGAGTLLLPSFRSSPGDPDARARFAAHRVQFQLIRDMLLNEPSVTSVGDDNVREYWLFDGRWSSPRRPGESLTRSEMLKAVDLSPKRYESYLDLLKSVGAYRAVRSGAAKNKRVVIHLLPTSKTDGPAPRVVYNAKGETPPGARATPLEDGWALEFDGN